jgi:hypothetical protein
MNWRDTLTPEEQTAVNTAAPGTLIHKLETLLDQREEMIANSRLPTRREISLLDKKPYIPPNIIRLDE